MIAQIEPKTMSIADFAARWGVSRETMRRIIKNNNDFPVLQLKRKLLVVVALADVWITQHLQRQKKILDTKP